MEASTSSIAAEHKYRSVFISDLHLGTPQAQTHVLLPFLQTVSAISCDDVRRTVEIIGYFSIRVLLRHLVSSPIWDTKVSNIRTADGCRYRRSDFT
jgi:hypothetical protein